MLKDVECNTCSSHEFEVLFQAGVAQQHRIVRCTRCGLMYASPRAVEHEHEVEEASDTEEYTQQRIMKERIQVGDYAPTRAVISAHFPRRGKILEIGSGFGYLLADFKKDGWDVVGLDPYAAACDYTKAHHGIDVVRGVLEEVNFPESAFQVVIMNHVIEHMVNPKHTLQLISRLLMKNGLLVIETPCYDSIVFKLWGKRERSLSCDGHIYFFTTKTLKDLCEACGFRSVQLLRTGRTLTLDRLVWNIGVMSKSGTVRRVLGGISKALSLKSVRIHLNFGDIQRICVVKQ